MEVQQANSHANRPDEAFWKLCFQPSAVPNPHRENNYILKCLLANDPQSLQPQQGPCNQPTHPVKTQYASASSGVQYHIVQQPFYQNVNGAQSKPHPAANSSPRDQMVYNLTFVSPTAHNQQTGYIQNHRQNGTQQRLPPAYNEVTSQTFATTSSPNPRISQCNSSVSLQNQQYASHRRNSAPHGGGEANYSVNTNSYTCYYIPKSVQVETNTQPSKMTAGPPQKRYGYHDQKAIARIANYLYESYPTGSNGHQHTHTSSPLTGRQFPSKNNKTMSNQMVQPTTFSFARQSNSNPTTRLQYVNTSTAQRTENMVPQKLAMPPVTVTGPNRTTNDVPSQAAVMHYGSDASQSMQLPLQRAVILLTGVNNQNDSSAQSSPGCASMRAVAVVQPLSQESSQVGNNQHFKPLEESTSTDKSWIHPGENVISPAVAKKAQHSNGFNAHLQSSNQKSPNNMHSAATNDRPVVSDSAKPQDMSQEQVAGEQCIPSVPQMSITSEVPQTQNPTESTDPKSTDPKTCVTDLSSVQTTPWTAAKLTNLIQDIGKAQVESQDSNVTSLRDKLRTLFWKQGSQHYHKVSSVSSLTSVANFCKKHVTSDTVILSQLKENCLKQLQNYCVLKQGEVYSEPPYISSWLNVNEQVDDIDKEFGFSYLYDRLQTCSQSDEVGEASFEMPNKDLSHTELVPADSGEENQDSVVKSTPTCPDEKGSTESSDSHYSFEIKVLPPEEAKSIFEQIHTASAQSMDIDIQPERVTEISMEDKLPNNEEVTGSDLEHGNKEVSSIETFCCLTRLMETLIGSESPLTCNCKKKQSGKDCAEKNTDKEEMVVQDDSQLHVNTLDRNEDTREKAEENGRCQNTTWSLSASSDDLCVDITGDGEKPHSQPEKSVDDSCSSILAVRESEDEELLSSQSEIPSDIPDTGSVISVPEEACVQEPCESADVGLTRNSDSEPPTSTHVAESTSDNAAQSQSSTTADLLMSIGLCDEAVVKKPKKKRSHNFFIPFPKKPKTSQDSEPVHRHVECKDVPATDGPSDSNVKNAELVLFGSRCQLESISFGGRKSDASPPKTLIVNLDEPDWHKSSVDTPKYSAKQMVHDSWRRSFVPIKMKRNGKLTLMGPVSDSTGKKRQLHGDKVKLVAEKMQHSVLKNRASPQRVQLHR